jgi:ketosteroid isomerase-like protein
MINQMYTEDAYLLPPGTETVKGRAAIQTFWTNAAAAIGDLKLTTVNVKPSGVMRLARSAPSH